MDEDAYGVGELLDKLGAAFRSTDLGATPAHSAAELLASRSTPEDADASEVP